MKRSALQIVTVIGIGFLALSTASSAATYQFAQTSDHSTDGVLGGTGPFNALNFIDVTGDATSTTISVFLDPACSGIVSTGAAPASLSFGLSGISSLDFQASTPNIFSAASGGVQVVGGGTPSLPATTQIGVAPTTLTINGFAKFAGDGFGLNVNSNGGSSPLAPNASGLALSFILTNISLTDFLADLRSSTHTTGQNYPETACTSSTTNCFFLDVQKSSGLTGVIDFGDPSLLRDNVPPPNPTPLPGALWLFASAVAGAAGIGKWRQKRKQPVNMAA